jgi:hypothetical protein
MIEERAGRTPGVRRPRTTNYRVAIDYRASPARREGCEWAQVWA